MFFAYHYRGRSYDCGSKLGFLTANVAFALERPDLAPRFGQELQKLAAELQARHSAPSEASDTRAAE
jgi:UTP--glucose-1-phosphate uridylyltransferase